MIPLTATQAERRFVLLNGTRWLPIGLTFGLTILLPLERGLSLADVAMLMAVQGFVVLGLELPTGGIADAIGRRPLLLIASALAVLSTVVFVTATSFAMFAVALVLQGVFRALDSGPLEAWFVDAAHAADPDAPIERGLSRAAMAIGVAIAGGALVGGGFVAWHPVAGWTALGPPFVLSIAVFAVYAVLVAVLVREPAREGGMSISAAARTAPVALVGGFRLVRTNGVLGSLVLVEVFWATAMIAFEMFTPVRLGELLGSEAAAGALFGPASAAAWGLFALGSAAAGIAARRWGVAVTAIIARLLNGAFVILMGVLAGPIGLLAGYGLAYLTHGAAGPMHSALLHRQSGQETRAMVLSINSMVSGGVYSLGLLVLAPLAETAGTNLAIVVAGAFSLLGALLYIPALRQERRGRAPEST